MPTPSKALPFIGDARSLMATADLCTTSKQQASNLYAQAARILRAIPSADLTPHEWVQVVSLWEECDAAI
jgi:hypothetical protein